MSPEVSTKVNPVIDPWGVSLLTINAVGAAGYVTAASHAWADPRVPVTGEPFIWAFTVFPIWAVFLLVNVAWGISILRRQPRGVLFGG